MSLIYKNYTVTYTLTCLLFITMCDLTSLNYVEKLRPRRIELIIGDTVMEKWSLIFHFQFRIQMHDTLAYGTHILHALAERYGRTSWHEMTLKFSSDEYSERYLTRILIRFRCSAIIQFRMISCKIIKSLKISPMIARTIFAADTKTPSNYYTRIILFNKAYRSHHALRLPSCKQ